jgi:hypothetical protein
MALPKSNLHPFRFRNIAVVVNGRKPIDTRCGNAGAAHAFAFD